MPNADIEKVKSDIQKFIGLDTNEIIYVSAKTSKNIEKIFTAIIRQIPAPTNKNSEQLKAIIFDSFNDYLDIVVLIRIKEGCIKEGNTVLFMASQKKYWVIEIGIKTDHEIRVKELHSGEIGYICAQIKSIKDITIGEIITLSNNSASLSLPGYSKKSSMVYCGLYPNDSNDYNELKKIFRKISLNDSALIY